MGSVAQLPGSEINLVVAVHANPGEDLEGPVEVAASQQVINALGPRGVGVRGVAGPVGEEVQELRV